ncbi:FAD-dependent monooxygenase [Gloeocapsopsis crepidinum LEGE 06123]|uniref:FAD-dependent monooxygenase n=1 Tax=Gloeocapsopsis crepidinum LEGE 06123 TaxID=588587 RepID=A0ABR9US57_9CHRO|nr:FAD-dependent monooxygenase [Gloeocapsopsis crepidinum]MBE9190193.1 FAD-dependent monooxygenase [Gloeocapsopsis crepidinum LEGE 06123]
MHATKIIIIGGGIGGAATALALHCAGLDFTVYERSQQLREVGAGIALWANATHILKNLGLLEDAIQVGCLTTNYQFNSQRGKELVNIAVYGFELPVIGIHRAELHQLLWRNVPREKFILGETFERFERRENRVCAYFKSGLSVVGGALIGADGLRSQVRTLLLGDQPPTYRNFKTWRGLTDYIPNGFRPGYIQEFLGCGKGFGFMMLGKGKMYWYAAAYAPEAQPDAAISRKQELERMYQDWFPSIPELIAATEEANILTTDLYDRPPIQPWSQQNITLLGDAAHPMLPTMGQGACTALEDAYVIAKCLQASDPITAFQNYESLRFERTKAIVIKSLRSSKMGELTHPLAVGFRNALMKVMSSAISNSFNSLHAYRT